MDIGDRPGGITLDDVRQELMKWDMLRTDDDLYNFLSYFLDYLGWELHGERSDRSGTFAGERPVD